MSRAATERHGSVTAMADGRDDRRGDQDGDGSSYDWLYSGGKGGSGGAGRPPADDPDATQVISTGPRSGAGTGRPPRDDGPPTSIAPAPGSPPPSARKPVKEPRQKRTRTRRRRPGRWLVVALLAWLVFLVAVPVLAWLSVDTVDAEPAGARPDDQPGTTYLVVGSDARKGLAGQRTDTILLLHTGSGPNLLMSLPRDSVVDIPDQGSQQAQRRVRAGRPEAAHAHDRVRDRHPHRPLRRDRVHRVRRSRRRRRGHRDLPDQGAEGPRRRAGRAQGLPGGRRRDGPRLRPHPQDADQRRHRPGQEPARGRDRDRPARWSRGRPSSTRSATGG